MALRDLMMRVGFEGNVTDLVEMNSAVDEVKENTGEATSSIGEMESATQDLSNTTGESSNFIADNWVAVTAGLTAVSGVAEKVTRSNAPLIESISKVSNSTGIADDDLKDLAGSMTNVTFPLEDVTQLMEIAGQQGLETAEELEDFGNFWDTVGDATGLSGPALGKAGTALRGVGIAAGEEKEALAAFGYITESTTGNVDEFLTFLDKTGPQLRDMGVDVDDSAALLGVLEHEFGMSGRTARQEFRKAVNEFDGDLDKMLDTLGISEEMMGSYREEVANSSDVIQDNADIHAETYTVTEKLAQKVAEMGFKYGDALGVVSDFAPILMAIGPVAKGVQTAQGLLSSGMMSKLVPSFVAGVKGALSFAGALLANPITWIVIGIVALGAAIWALATDFGGVTTWIKEKFSAVGEWFRGAFSSIGEWFSGKFAAIADWFRQKVTEFSEIGRNVVNFLRDGIQNMFGSLKSKASEVITSVVTTFKEKVSNFLTIGGDIITKFISGVSSMIGSLKSKATEAIMSGVTAFTDKVAEFKNIGSNVISSFIGGFTSKLGALKDTVVGAAGKVGGWFKDKLGIASPSKVMISHGLDTGEGVNVGLKKSLPRIEDTTDDMAMGVSRGFNPSTKLLDRGSRGNVYSPNINIEINSDVDNRAIGELEKTIKRVLEAERKTFFNNLALQR